MESGLPALTTKAKDRITAKSALESFSQRAFLKCIVPEAALSNLSFYSFYRMYDVFSGRIVTKRREQFVAVSGSGWPTQAKGSHQHHESYAKAKNTLCLHALPFLRGTDYIDEVVRTDYDNCYASLLAAFVRDRLNQ
jgi:hypothetical protein